MEGRLEEFELRGRNCTLWMPGGDGPFPVAFLCGGDLRKFIPKLIGDLPGMVLFSAKGSWESDFTPWPVEALENREPFTGGARDYLCFLEEAIPYLEETYYISVNPEQAALMGYSLGGLFAIWAMYNTKKFSVFASLSGSLWYDGFQEYMEAHRPNPGTKVYISLGKSEEHTSQARVRSVGEKTVRAASILEWALGEGSVVLEWNRGGHFTGILNRWRKALQWALINFE